MRHLSLTFITFVIAWSCTNFKEEEAPVHLSSDVYEYSSSERLTEFHLNVSSGSKWYITYMPYWINLQSIDESPRSPYEWDVNFEIEGNGEYGREGQIDIYNETGESIYVTVSQAGAKGKYIALESLEINSALTTIIEGQSQQLSVRYFPSNASEKQVIWTSSDPYVAQVSESGLLTAISVGSATITVHSEDGKHIAKCIFNVISKTIDVTGVSLDNTSITMTEGTTQTLTATVAPENATDKSVTWSSNNTSVATVSSEGVVTAKTAGTATITVKTTDGGKTATCTVTVKAATVSVTGVSLNKTSMSMTVGDTQTLTATITPSNATDKSVTWSSNNTSVATVSSSGVVTAKAAGMATITVKTTDGSKTATCTVTVKAATVSVTGVSLDNTSITMTEGTTQTLTATVAPENATDKSVTWSSNNISVATVSSSGVVTAKAAGTATITVKTNDGAKTATCSVTVKAATVAVTGVSLDKNSLSLRVGDVSTLTATVMPSNATDKSVTWSSSNTAIATVSSTGVVTANNVGSAVITVATNDGNLTASCSVSVGYAIPGIVDLGIGVKWGSFNLGAVKPEDSGYYYPWGYTEPQAFSHNDFIWFFLDSYKWYYSPDRTLTKYCSNASYGRNGYTDNKNVLDKEDDAAYVNLGSQWRLPTAGDYSLLQEKCSWEWKSVNGVGGYEVTGPNGNSIFLPAAGYGYFTEFHDFGALGHCWSSSLKTEYPYNAYALKCGSSVIENESMSRSFLLPVRPVFGESTYVSITGVSLNASSISMTVGDTQTLTATITPSNATDKSVTWSSNNTSVATVSSSGVVTAKAAGTATITVNTNDGGKTATCTVTVKASTVAVTGVSLDKSKMYSPIDNTQALTATVTPSDATDKSVSWSSSNTSIATVSSSGIVTTKSPGTARITVTTKDGSKTASCIVKVASFSYDYVDLGLSSGLKWATCNLGASSPEESGDFFAWGETIPRENSTFTWGTYKWYDSSTNTLIKYYSSSPSVLLYSDDAASVNLGGNWRMPTNTEWYELINSCTWTWTGNGVSILGPNGSSIFLPSAGLGVVDAGYVGGYYWSSSLNISSTDSAWAVSFYLNNINRGKQYRYFGSSIRPVMD